MALALIKTYRFSPLRGSRRPHVRGQHAAIHLLMHFDWDQTGRQLARPGSCKTGQKKSLEPVNLYFSLRTFPN